MAETPTSRFTAAYPTAKKALNVTLFNVGWFACVLGAAAGRFWVGPLAVAGIFTVDLWLCRHRRAELSLIAASMLIGFACDSLLVLLGVHEPRRWLLPQPLATVWLVAMWGNFAPLLSVSLRWLRGRLPLAAALGAIGGPLAYYSGQQLGALSLGEPMIRSSAILAVAWAGAIPLLVWLSEAVERRFATVMRSPGRSQGPDAE